MRGMICQHNGIPTGLVFFYSGTTELNVNGATLSTTAGATTATYTYMATAPSATPLAITARYSGDSGYVASSSAATNLMVAGSTASAGAATLSFTSGATTGNTDTITFTSVGGFAGTIAVTCIITPNSGTPAFPATCAASPASVSIATGGTATSAIVISSTTAQGKISESERAGVIGRRLCDVACVAMLVCLVPFRRRFIRSLTVFLLLSCALVVISGCSGSGTGSTPANRSSAGIYTVTATGSSSTAQSTVTFTVTIN
jgi:hypothetical protein